jgi:hypothetical protein
MAPFAQQVPSPSIESVQVLREMSVDSINNSHTHMRNAGTLNNSHTHMRNAHTGDCDGSRMCTSSALSPSSVSSTMSTAHHVEPNISSPAPVSPSSLSQQTHFSSSLSSSCCSSSSNNHNNAAAASLVFSRFRDLQSQVVELNNRGMELFAMKKHQSSLFHFNEAFRMLTSTGSTLLDCAVDVDPDEFRIVGEDHPSSLFGRKPMPPTDLMLPLEPLSLGVPRSVDDIQGWVLLASMILMVNGALGHLQRGKFENAKQLLRMAIALSDDEEDRDCADDANSESERFDLLRRQYHVKMVLMSVYFILGQVQSKPTEEDIDGKLSEARMRECMVSFTESLSLAGDLLGKNHFTLALIYVTIGQVLLREGYMRGASVSFRHAEEIYNRPRAALSNSASSSTGGVNNEQPQHHDAESMVHMSDLEVATMLLGCSFSYGAPVA